MGDGEVGHAELMASVEVFDFRSVDVGLSCELKKSERADAAAEVGVELDLGEVKARGEEGLVAQKSVHLLLFISVSLL